MVIQELSLIGISNNSKISYNDSALKTHCLHGKATTQKITLCWTYRHEYVKGESGQTNSECGRILEISYQFYFASIFFLCVHKNDTMIKTYAYIIEESHFKTYNIQVLSDKKAWCQC